MCIYSFYNYVEAFVNFMYSNLPWNTFTYDDPFFFGGGGYSRKLKRSSI